MLRAFLVGCCLGVMGLSPLNVQAKNHVLITAGQSNTDGRVSNKHLPLYIKALATDTVDYQDGAYRHCKIAQNRTDGQFVPFFPKGRITQGLWAYDAVIYYQLERALQQDFYVVKYAVGGTSIQYPNDSAKGRYWSANPDWLAKTVSIEKGGQSILLSLTEAIDAAIDETLSNLEGGYTIDAFLWHQGESDNRYPKTYYANLKALVDYVRNHLTAKTGVDYSQLPFIFGTVSTANRQYQPLVEAGMRRLANDDLNAYLIDMSKGTLLSDRLHFDVQSATYLGEAMFNILSKVMPINQHGFSVARFKDDKRAAVSYTFDDALIEHATLVAPRMEKLGFRGTFWVNGRTVSDTAAALGKPRTSWKQLKQMANAGHEVSNHGWAHRSVTRLNPEELRHEVAYNDTLIYRHTGVFPRTFCYPGNAKNDSVIAVIEKGRIGTRTFQFSLGSKSTRKNLEKRVDQWLANGEWAVAMTHGINYGYDAFRNADVFWEHLNHVKAREDSLWVGTFRDVAAYTKAQKALTYTVTSTSKGLTVTPHLSLDETLFRVPLTGVIEQANLKKIAVRQGGKRLKVRILPDKALFTFDPYGGPIDVVLTREK